MTSPESRQFLDSPYARLVALGCFALSAAALVYVHRDDLFAQPAETAAVQGDDPFARCFRDGTAAIDRMLADNTIGAEQARLFRQRAEARCRAQTGTGGGPPVR